LGRYRFGTLSLKPFDPASIDGGGLTVAVVGLIAAWQPMRRAMNIDPALVLEE
jgi:ABC-type antimicrobial peptide transport system permease subunit